ncbi:MAG: hypothetical protein WBJ75_07705 [Pseudohongiellaceae bacterium]
MNKTKLALAIGALSMAAGQSALAAEFTVSGVIEGIYNYNTTINPAVTYGSPFSVTVTYDDSAAPDSYYNYNDPSYYGYSQQQAEWYNSIDSMVVSIYDTAGNLLESQEIVRDEDGYTTYYNTAGNYQYNYNEYYGNQQYSQTYFNIQHYTYDGQVETSQYSQVYFYSHMLDLVVDAAQYPTTPTQAQLDTQQVSGHFYSGEWQNSYYYGTNYQWQFSGRITSASGVIPTVIDSDDDGIPDAEDAFPNDATESSDTDGDGVGDNGDAFPSDATETADADGDGVGDNGDAFPNDATESADADGDGVGNNADQNDSSDLSATVVIDGNNSGVTNSLVSNGQTLADIINAEATVCKATAKNHGAYTSCVGKVLNALKAAGTITDAQKDALQSAVAKSSFGKK